MTAEQYEDILDYLRGEIRRKDEEMADLNSKLARTEMALRGVYVAACLKFGQMVGPMVCEMILPTNNMGASSYDFELTITERVDKSEQTVRVKRIE